MSLAGAGVGGLGEGGRALRPGGGGRVPADGPRPHGQPRGGAVGAVAGGAVGGGAAAAQGGVRHAVREAGVGPPVEQPDRHAVSGSTLAPAYSHALSIRNPMSRFYAVNRFDSHVAPAAVLLDGLVKPVPGPALLGRDHVRLGGGGVAGRVVVLVAGRGGLHEVGLGACGSGREPLLFRAGKELL